MKYLKPKSVTWWVSILQIAVGIVLAATADGQWVHTFLTNATGGLEPYALISAGAFGVGLRGAIA